MIIAQVPSNIKKITKKNCEICENSVKLFCGPFLLRRLQAPYNFGTTHFSGPLWSKFPFLALGPHLVLKNFPYTFSVFEEFLLVRFCQFVFVDGKFHVCLFL